MTIDMNTVREFARQIAKSDRAACIEAETEMDDVWGWEHTVALATHLGVSPAHEMDPEAVRVAKEAYAQEVQS